MALFSKRPQERQIQAGEASGAKWYKCTDMHRSDAPYSYRADPDVPSWDDGPELIVYDGRCVLCSGFVRFVIRRDRFARFRFTMAQSSLGQALYRHYRLDPVEFETNLVIADGRLHAKLASFTRVMIGLGWPWRVAALLRAVPGPVADWLYDRIAGNRYRLFGRYDACQIPTAELSARIID